jgi:hypothetical protein
MLVLQINEPEVKGFMQKLLRSECFDNFDVRGIEIVTYTKLSLDGVDYSNADKINFCKWKKLKEHALEFIMNGGKPSFLKVVFSYDEANLSRVHNNAKSLFLNMHYENEQIQFTTATSQAVFALDKSVDAAWEQAITGFFDKNEIKYEVIE